MASTRLVRTGSLTVVGLLVVVVACSRFARWPRTLDAKLPPRRALLVGSVQGCTRDTSCQQDGDTLATCSVSLSLGTCQCTAGYFQEQQQEGGRSTCRKVCCPTCAVTCCTADTDCQQFDARASCAQTSGVAGSRCQCSSGFDGPNCEPAATCIGNSGQPVAWWVAFKRPTAAGFVYADGSSETATVIEASHPSELIALAATAATWLGDNTSYVVTANGYSREVAAVDPASFVHLDESWPGCPTCAHSVVSWHGDGSTSSVLVYSDASFPPRSHNGTRIAHPSSADAWLWPGDTAVPQGDVPLVYACASTSGRLATALAAMGTASPFVHMDVLHGDVPTAAAAFLEPAAFTDTSVNLRVTEEAFTACAAATPPWSPGTCTSTGPVAGGSAAVVGMSAAATAWPVCMRVDASAAGGVSGLAPSLLPPISGAAPVSALVGQSVPHGTVCIGDWLFASQTPRGMPDNDLLGPDTSPSGGFGLCVRHTQLWQQVLRSGQWYWEANCRQWKTQQQHLASKQTLGNPAHGATPELHGRRLPLWDDTPGEKSGGGSSGADAWPQEWFSDSFTGALGTSIDVFGSGEAGSGWEPSSDFGGAFAGAGAGRGAVGGFGEVVDRRPRPSRARRKRKADDDEDREDEDNDGMGTEEVDEDGDEDEGPRNKRAREPSCRWATVSHPTSPTESIPAIRIDTWNFEVAHAGVLLATAVQTDRATYRAYKMALDEPGRPFAALYVARINAAGTPVLGDALLQRAPDNFETIADGPVGLQGTLIARHQVEDGGQFAGVLGVAAAASEVGYGVVSPDGGRITWCRQYMVPGGCGYRFVGRDGHEEPVSEWWKVVQKFHARVALRGSMYLVAEQDRVQCPWLSLFDDLATTDAPQEDGGAAFNRRRLAACDVGTYANDTSTCTAASASSGIHGQFLVLCYNESWSNPAPTVECSASGANLVSLYDSRSRLSLFTSYWVTRTQVLSAERSGSFRLNGVPSASVAGSRDYKSYSAGVAGCKGSKSLVHIGHFAPNAIFQEDATLMKDTFVYANASPQHPSMNSGQWAQGEKAIRDYLATTRVNVEAHLATGIGITAEALSYDATALTTDVDRQAQAVLHRVIFPRKQCRDEFKYTGGGVTGVPYPALYWTVIHLKVPAAGAGGADVDHCAAVWLANPYPEFEDCPPASPGVCARNAKSASGVDTIKCGTVQQLSTHLAANNLGPVVFPPWMATCAPLADLCALGAFN